MLKHPAEFTVHTPTGPVHCCVKHARQIEGLMRMLGAHTHAVKAPDGVECANSTARGGRRPERVRWSDGLCGN